MVEWINNLMGSLGYWGIGLLMFLENLFPPIPSELIMPLAGFTVAQGKMNFGLAVLAGTVGTMAGTYAWYYLGRLVNYQRLQTWTERYGKWIGVTAKDIDRVNDWFNKYGVRAVFFGRMVPGIRTLISLPAGMNQMPFISFTIYSTIGTSIWTLALTAAGFLLGDNYASIEGYLAPVSKLVVFGLLGLLGYAIFKKMRSRN
ncbi:DedA family protein [Chamaesiphon minutus]|uniref:Putative membrane-associated protein n=1 Tax=Chamaesiphon minutus (strain ATCC 27169 / PCC 6605) TaxID=1173020 RepID=K9UAT9_CHAP6|nr:DedA family protein [Chamaesiphon minutus]AFY91743.1 putative membrane-associated protein [Chamaesiphon minutus PCC 6605]